MVVYRIEEVNEWLLFNIRLAILQLYRGDDKQHYDERMMIRIYIVLVHCINSPQVDMLPLSDKLSWFRANQSLLFIFNKATNIDCVVMWLEWIRGLWYPLMFDHCTVWWFGLWSVASSNPVHDEVYSIQQYVMQVGGFLKVPRFPPPIKLIATI
jgi:hypothetical protein